MSRLRARSLMHESSSFRSDIKLIPLESDLLTRGRAELLVKVNRTPIPCRRLPFYCCAGKPNSVISNHEHHAHLSMANY